MNDTYIDQNTEAPGQIPVFQEYWVLSLRQKIKKGAGNGMWCKSCNIETDENICPICGDATAADTPIEVFWCKNCNVPVINLTNQIDKGVCPVCGKKTKYLSTDLRPVFPEERLLIELLLDLKPNEWVEKSVWAANNRYYVDGKSTALPSKLFQMADTDRLSKLLEEYRSGNTYDYFEQHVQQFIKANEYTKV